VTTARSIAVLSSLALSTSIACSNRPPTAAARSDAPRSLPAAASAHASGAKSVTATVLETMDASNYTYLRVKTDSGEVWAAAPRFKAAVGDTVVVPLDQPMENFHSQSLNRDFPLIYFVSQLSPGGQTAGTTPAAAEPAAIEPTAGGTTVESLWKTRDTLAGKSVTVRGKVVKFNGGILGVNWIHLQDGTGKADDQSNDITVTSTDDTKVGDVITVTGIVALNKDLGSGYKYPVIIEHARIK
jgi:hypothetical protein